MNFIFITGVGRCGTNVIKGLIDGHSEVNVLPGELNVITHYNNSIKFKTKKKYKDELIDSFLRQIPDDKNFIKKRFEKKIIKFKRNKNFIKDFEQILKFFFLKKKKYVLINTQNENISFLKKIFKNCKIIHMLRNPLTQINSRYLFRFRSMKENFRGNEFTNSFRRNYLSFKQANIFKKDSKVKIVKMENLLSNTNYTLNTITKFLDIKKIDKLELTEMDGKFISSLNGKLVATKLINKKINKDYSNLLPNDLYYCSLITTARKFYKYPYFQKSKNNFILYFLRHFGFIGKHREISINPYVIFKRFLYTIYNYSVDRSGKEEFEIFLKNKKNYEKKN
jgi:hypothetical protein